MVSTHHGTTARSRSLASHNFCLQTAPFCSFSLQLRHRGSLTASSFTISIPVKAKLFFTTYKSNYNYKFSYGRHKRQVKASLLVPSLNVTLLKKDKIYPITGLDSSLMLRKLRLPEFLWSRHTKVAYFEP